jgi:type I restriction enzyme S subunit
MYYALQTIDILNKNNYERHFKYLKSSSIFVSTYKSEQQKIAKFLSLIDARIDNAKAIKEQLRLKKEYYLQNLFPQDGQTMPNIRFKEFSGGWKRQELQNYVNDIY